MTTMHIGIKADEVEQVRDLAPNGITVDGDRWEEWGERPISNDDPRHVILFGDSEALLADFAYLLGEGVDFQPMHLPHQRGVIAVLTPEDDWSEPYYQITDARAKRARVDGEG